MPSTQDQAVQLVALAIFVVALAHTFAAKQFERLAHRYPRHAGLLHLLGEVEVVFGFWAIVLVASMALIAGGGEAVAYAESRNYTEPLFVFVVTVVAASRPILRTVMRAVDLLARRLPFRLTVIANAPNPAGVALLQRGFSDETNSAGGLL